MACLFKNSDKRNIIMIDCKLNIYKEIDNTETIVGSFVQIDKVMLEKRVSYKDGSSTQTTKFSSIPDKTDIEVKESPYFFHGKNCKSLIKETFDIHKNKDGYSYSAMITKHFRNGDTEVIEKVSKDSNSISNIEITILNNLVNDILKTKDACDENSITFDEELAEEDFKYFKNQFEKMLNASEKLIEELSIAKPDLNQIIELPSKILDPKFMVISDTKDKKMAFNPENNFNYINSKGQNLISFSEETNNPIKVNNFKNELIIVPDVLVELNSSERAGKLLPLDKLDDLIIDVISSFRIANSEIPINLDDPNCIKILRNQRPLNIPENKLVGLVYKTKKPTKKQKEEFLSHFNRLIKTDYFHSYKDQGSHYLSKSGVKDEEGYEFEVSGTILDGKVTKRINPNKTETRVYTITGMPAFLEHAILIRQIKSIPINLLDSKSVQSSNDFNLVKNYLGKRIGNTLSKLNKKKGHLDIKDYDLIINLETLFNENQVEFTGKTKRVKKQRFINKIKDCLEDLKNSCKGLDGSKLIDYELYPNVPRKPKEKILLVFQDEKGKVFRPKTGEDMGV